MDPYLQNLTETRKEVLGNLKAALDNVSSLIKLVDFLNRQIAAQKPSDAETSSIAVEKPSAIESSGIAAQKPSAAETSGIAVEKPSVAETSGIAAQKPSAPETLDSATVPANAVDTWTPAVDVAASTAVTSDAIEFGVALSEVTTKASPGDKGETDTDATLESTCDVKDPLWTDPTHIKQEFDVSPEDASAADCENAGRMAVPTESPTISSTKLTDLQLNQEKPAGFKLPSFREPGGKIPKRSSQRVPTVRLEILQNMLQIDAKKRRKRGRKRLGSNAGLTDSEYHEKLRRRRRISMKEI